MIGDRLTQLAQATGVAIEFLRGASQLEDVAQGVLERLANAAGCELVSTRSGRYEPVPMILEYIEQSWAWVRLAAVSRHER